MRIILLSLILISCGRDGQPGVRGARGPAGVAGPGCSVTQVDTGAVIACENGSVANIANGTNGDTGPQGIGGTDGSSCTVTQLSNGSRIDCSDDTHAVVVNGSDGLAGPTGETGEPGIAGADAPLSAYSVASVIDPCSTAPGFNEVLLRLQNNQILAHYADGAKQFFSLIGPGSYITTDGDACKFSIDNNGNIYNEHH